MEGGEETRGRREGRRRALVASGGRRVMCSPLLVTHYVSMLLVTSASPDPLWTVPFPFAISEVGSGNPQGPP